MIRRLLCALLGHGPWHRVPIGGVWHEGELRACRRCLFCDQVELLEVLG